MVDALLGRVFAHGIGQAKQLALQKVDEFWILKILKLVPAYQNLERVCKLATLTAVSSHPSKKTEHLWMQNGRIRTKNLTQQNNHKIYV
jgi:hypothetical protein